ncbi:hypothetical protein CACET_c32020 [Clostridium aceticum]|uniref:Uncharacterized protein n=1 Tax=Clostridium aceticum TaxID=84022 RepID=A0A0D8I6Z7_9CLOT|nr:hypothetical protein [Clostridium aceticum]AKL96646.1 hypothetical protein CACET_c32020 [Clostridium aceticum]KJF26055.1 hypothetical protein TZ02_15125 [Clostridium aceticum]
MFDVKLPVLEKDDNWIIHIEKLKEESKELTTVVEILDYIEQHETNIKTPEKAAADAMGEALDVMQVCIGIIEKVMEKHPQILKQVVDQHLTKLSRRGWNFRKMLQIHED